MILLRDHNFIEERLFSAPIKNFITKHSRGVVKQIVKIYQIHKGQTADDCMVHWVIDGLQNTFLKNSRDLVNQRDIRYQSIFLLNEEGEDIINNPRITKYTGGEISNEVRSSKVSFWGDDFIKDGIKKAEGDDGRKYSRFFRNLENDKDVIEDYRHLLKYVALSISGQINPEVVDYYDGLTYKLEVDYDRVNTKILTINEVRATIMKCIVSALEAKGEEISPEITRLTDPKEGR